MYGSTSALAYVLSVWSELRMSRRSDWMKSTKTRSTGASLARPEGASVPMKSGVEKNGCEEGNGKGMSARAFRVW